MVAIHSFTYLQKRLPSASTHASSHARHWLMDGVNGTLFNVAPNVQQAIRSHFKWRQQDSEK